MNDHLVLVEHVLGRRGVAAGREVDAVHHALHRTINSVNGHVPPIEAVTATS